MAGYASGEQPQEDGWIKLNTNENPYPPSPRVIEAIRQAATSRLNVYPDARATPFRNAAAPLFGCDPDWILPANGSDENLTIIVRSTCDAGDRIAYPYPSYVLYETLAKIQNCAVDRLRLNSAFDWSPDAAATLRQTTRVFFVPNPNSPTGNRWSADQLAELRPENGLLILDEAYGDFPDKPHRAELLRDERFDRRMVITRTLSKSYSLAGLRFGFAIAHPDLIAEMNKVRDSYNCDAISIAAATAAIEDQEWMLANRAKIVATRNRLAKRLPAFGFSVTPSEANFLWVQHASGQHDAIFAGLKSKKILIRFMKFPDANTDSTTLDGLRISIGSDDETDQLLDAMQGVISSLA